MIQSNLSKAKRMLSSSNNTSLTISVYLEGFKIILYEFESLIVEKGKRINGQKEKLTDLLEGDEKENKKKMYWINKQEDELNILFTAYTTFNAFCEQIKLEINALCEDLENKDKQIANGKYLLHQAFLEVESLNTGQKMTSRSVDYFLQLSIDLLQNVIDLNKQIKTV